MENNPLVSIITVVFNNKRFIGSAIESVISQSYKNIEYIIIDGGSTDGTLEVVEKYKNRISKLISEPDQGIYDAMNKGIKLAKGEIIGTLNADDFYADNDVIENIVKIFKDKNCDVLWGNLVYIDRDDDQKIKRVWRSSEYSEGKFKKGWHPAHPTFFVKKDIYQKYGMFDLKFKIAADYELMLRFLERYKVKSCYINKILVKMRLGGESNKSIKNIILANRESYQAWKANGLEISLFAITLKPLSKIFQYFKNYE